VHSLYVAPLRWRQGIGHDLMATATDYLSSAGFREATLWVLQANRQGRSFYEKEGWQADGATQVLQRAPGVSELRYRLTLA
jgi:GNAT superfamily N-acetyltransferase